MVNTAPRPAVRRWSPRPSAPVRLVCFPHAGGGAGAYRDWAAALPDTVEVLSVQYPGREDRTGDPLPDSMPDLIAQLAADLRPFWNRTTVVFGHSMGAAVAYETVRALRDQGLPEPDHLLVSGRRAPDRFLGGDVHRSGEAGLRAELEQLGGTPPEVLADPDLSAAILRYVHHDYRLIENHHPQPGPPLTCPTTVVLAQDDPLLLSEHVPDWHRLTTGPADVVELPGDHFYLVPHRDLLLRTILDRLDPALTTTGVGP